MKVRTRMLGTVEVTEDALVYLPDGLLGFEDLKRYVLAENEELGPFQLLISTEDPDVVFAVADPDAVLGEEYAAPLADSDRDLLDLQADDRISTFVLLSTADGDDGFTANLKGPVVLNTRNRVAKQVVVYNPAYSFRHPFAQDQEEQGAQDRMSRLRAQVYR
ncbi:MAG: flagellar assembly protein FliW [Candidatus Eisenbacteria bacterium]